MSDRPSSALLPVPLGPLVGRQAELRQADELLAGARLVTFTGAGGSGKTRLAIEAARRFIAEQGGEAAFVDLAPVADPELVADHLAAALELRLAAGRDSLSGLVAALQPHPLLLVLDNCEHLVDRCAEVVQTLLQGCPGLRVLATSREPLGLPGERLWLVPPLSLPAPAEACCAAAAAGADAVALFVARAREANPAFRLDDANAPAVAAICRRLDGLPLALELAAARTRVLSTEQIAARLDDAFRLLTTGGRTSLPRQKTLRGAFDWSHDLLGAEQQVLLRRLSVFAGGFALDAVEGVCAGGGEAGEALDAEEVLDALSGLVDRSLVTIDGGDDELRYRLLETVRQYAAERLRDSGEEAAVRRRHAEWFAALAETLAPQVFGGEGPPAAMRRLDLEQDNLRLAADHALGDEDGGAVALRLATSLHWYWFARGLFQEGWRRLAGAIVHGVGADPLLRARGAVAAGSMAIWIGRPEAARAAVAQAVGVLRESGSRFWLAYGLATLGALELAGGCDDAPAPAAAALDEAAAVAAALPHDVMVPFVSYWQGRAAHRRGDLAAARAAFERGLAVGRRTGNSPSIGHSLHLLGRVEHAQGRHPEARELVAEALAVHVRSGNCWGVAQALLELASIERAQGEPRRATRLLAAGRAHVEQAGVSQIAAEAAEAARLAEELQAELGAAAFEVEAARGQAVRAADALALLGDELAADAADEAAGAANAECCPPPGEPPAPLVFVLGRAAATTSTAEPASDAGGDGPPLDIAALGPLRIGRDGAPAAADGWSSARTRELLVFLLLHPDGATKEEIGLALWPEASAAQLRNSFHVALHRLRAALGRAEAVEVIAGRYRLDPALADGFDVPRFESGARGALAALAAGREEALADLLAALELYRGELLAGEGAGEWHLERRDRLQQLYVDALAAAGEALEAAERSAEAAAVYRRWIAADDLCEHAYRRLMICLDDTGERAEALRVYQRLAAVLERELGVEPDAETRQVHEQIRRAGLRPSRRPAIRPAV
jgi:predicted ATPase/DNA-binding SARP family transcriptional activator